MRAMLAATAAGLLVVSSPAQTQLRPLDVPPNKGWQHAQSGLILMPKLGEFQRESLKDNGQFELDVAATYRTSDQKSVATIYLYRPGVFDVPMWFDRSHLAMSFNKTFSLGAPTGLVTRFATPGTTTQGGFRITYAMNGRPIGATGLAVAPIGDWLVAIRLTSDTMDGATLDATLTDLIGKIRWPTKIEAARVADPIQPCTKPIKFKHAKVLQPDLGQALLGAAVSMAMHDKAKEQSKPDDAPTYCLEGKGAAEYSVYRPINSDGIYVLALGDAGIAARVSPEFSLEGGKRNFAVVLEDLDSSDSYPAFNALPEPGQVFEMLSKMSPVSSASRSSKDITISTPAK